MNLELYVKHILNWHDGEVRLLGDPSWAKFPATGGDQVGSDGLTVFHPRFWRTRKTTLAAGVSSIGSSGASRTPFLTPGRR